MKKSNQVPLMVIGTLSLFAGCNRNSDTPVQLAQNIYASLEDCRQDWGNDERDCKPSGSGGGGYSGPRYYWDRASGYPYALDPDGRTRPLPNAYLSRGGKSAATGVTHSSVSRGGFGSIARGFSGGG